MIVDISHQHARRRFPHRETRRVLACVVKGERKKLQRVSVVFTDNRYMRVLNAAYLRHDRPTDVMAFSLGTRGRTEGEIYVSLDQARMQAMTYTVTTVEEVRRLLIHGALHLLGYRDKSVRDRQRMKSREERYLSLLNREE